MQNAWHSHPKAINRGTTICVHSHPHISHLYVYIYIYYIVYIYIILYIYIYIILYIFMCIYINISHCSCIMSHRLAFCYSTKPWSSQSWRDEWTPPWESVRTETRETPEMIAYAPWANRHHLGRMEWGEAMWSLGSGIWLPKSSHLGKTLPRCHPNPGIDTSLRNLRNLTTKYANILMYVCFAPFDVFESDIFKKNQGVETVFVCMFFIASCFKNASQQTRKRGTWETNRNLDHQHCLNPQIKFPNVWDFKLVYIDSILVSSRSA